MGLLVLNYAYIKGGMKQFTKSIFIPVRFLECLASPVLRLLWAAVPPGYTAVLQPCDTSPCPGSPWAY